MRPKESTLKKKVLLQLKSLPKTWAVKIQQASIVGTPDILACVAGHFISLELKRDDKAKTTPIQDYNLKKIKEAGGKTYVVTPANWDEVFAELKSLVQAPRPSLRDPS